MNSWFLNVIENNFAKTTLTKEDLKKQEQYVAKIKRDTLSKDISYEDFLDSLNIKLNFHVDDNRFIERYAQMTQKTNQFNLTTKRYTVTEINHFITSKEYKVIAVEYQDKFENEGIIGLIITHESTDTVEIDTLLLSCRVLKRGVEKAIFNKLDTLYKEKDIVGVYIPTKKNIQTKELYLEYGFEQINENEFIKRGTKNEK